MNRSKVIETLDNLPVEFSTEELIERLLFVEKIERGMKEEEEGKLISLEGVKDRIAKKWQK